MSQAASPQGATGGSAEPPHPYKNKAIGLAVAAAVGGFLFGFDSSVINGAVNAIEDEFDINPAVTGLVVAIALLGCAFGAWLGGKLDDRLGPKRVIAGSLLILLLAIAAILLVDKDSILFVKVEPPKPGGALFSGAAERAYLVLGCLIGAAGGPLQAASRSLLIRLAPRDRIAQYFGLFALTGKVTSFIGPLLIGTITAVTASQKAGMAILVLFFVAGLALLTRVRE
jgi:UMF1 family MFS transporter